MLVWGAVAFSAVTWALQWSALDASPRQAQASPPAVSEVNTAAVAQTLGAAPVQALAAPTLASRFQLLGVMAGDASQAAALIAVDGQAAKPFRVGAVVADGWVLQSAHDRRVSLGATANGAQTLVLELPAKK
jgi:general secretion pathway protein C